VPYDSRSLSPWFLICGEFKVLFRECRFSAPTFAPPPIGPPPDTGNRMHAHTEASWRKCALLRSFASIDPLLMNTRLFMLVPRGIDRIAFAQLWRSSSQGTASWIREETST
jgi:hypothetical protein